MIIAWRSLVIALRGMWSLHRVHLWGWVIIAKLSVWPRSRSGTSTGTRSRPRAHTRAHTRAHRTHIWTHIQAHVWTHILAHILAHVRAHARTHVWSHTWPHTWSRDPWCPPLIRRVWLLFRWYLAIVRVRTTIHVIPSSLRHTAGPDGRTHVLLGLLRGSLLMRGVRPSVIVHISKGRSRASKVLREQVREYYYN